MKLMKTTLGLIAFALVLPLKANAECAEWMNVDLQKLRSKETVNLCSLAEDKTLLIVNTASQCGFTHQFESLEALYQKYKDQGLEIVGFPSDTFRQEHDDAEKTAEVCYINYGVTFTMMETSPVRGKKANPVFNHLNEAVGKPSWNFNKFLVNKEGKAIERFGSKVKPMGEEMTKAIETVL